MARVTVEDCVTVVTNRFELCLIASNRAKSILSGANTGFDRKEKPAVIALREVAENLIDVENIRKNIVSSIKHRGIVQFSDIDEEEEITNEPEITDNFSGYSEVEETKGVGVADRKKKLGVWDKMRHTLIEMFKEEEDKVMRELKATMNMIRAFRTTEDIKEDARIYRENLNKDENGNRTIDAYCAKLRKQKIYRDAYKERQKIKELAKTTQ
jgi:DNA-directed RNA polymerase subunit omega